MKKTFITLGILVSSLSFSLAQISGTVQGTVGGVPVGVTVGGASVGGPSQAVGGNLLSLLTFVQTFVNRLVPLFIGIAVLAIFYGIIKFVIAGKNGDQQGHDSAIKFLGMSILGLFVMVSIWGLVAFLGSILGVGQGGSVPVPVIPTGPTN